MPPDWLSALSLVLITAVPSAQAAQESPYRTTGTCDGFPRLPVLTAPGTCVGLIASGFKFPRGILPLDNGDLLVVDMGGWAPNRGSLWLLRKAASGYQRERLLDKLDRPHGRVARRLRLRHRSCQGEEDCVSRPPSG